MESCSLAARCTPFYVETAAGLRLVLDVDVTVPRPVSQLELAVRARRRVEWRRSFSAPAPGVFSFEAHVHPLTRPAQATVTLTIPGTPESQMIAIELRPMPRWRLFLAPGNWEAVTWGAADESGTAARLVADCQAVLCGDLPSYTLTSVSALRQCERLLPAETFAGLLQAVREGRVEVGVLENHFLTGLLPHELLARACVAHAHLREEHGLPSAPALLAAVPAAAPGITGALLGSGVTALGSWADPRYAWAAADYPTAAWRHWRGPHGGELNAWLALVQDRLALTGEGAPLRAQLAGLLGHRFSEATGPSEMLLVPVSVGASAEPLKLQVDGWNQRYAFPQLQISPVAAFFAAADPPTGRPSVTTQYLPAFREAGVASHARLVAPVRAGVDRLTTAEPLFALLAALGVREYPVAAFAGVWQDLAACYDAVWAPDDSARHPQAPATLQALARREAQVVAMDDGCEALIRQGLLALAEGVRVEEPSVLVFNPSHWPRAGVASDGEDDVAVGEVPPLGYRLFSDRDARLVRLQLADEGEVIENRFYRLRVDTFSGAVVSLFDKELQRELVDTSSGFHLNELVYVLGGEHSRICPEAVPADASVLPPRYAPDPLHIAGEPLLDSAPIRDPVVRVGHLHGVGPALRVLGQTFRIPRYTSVVTLREDRKQIDVENVFSKTPTYSKEALYFAFPFSLANARCVAEVPGGSTDLQVTPGQPNWYAVLRWLCLENDDLSVLWSSADAPLVTLGDLYQGIGGTPATANPARLFSLVMHNYYEAHFAPAQGGDFSFSYSITTARRHSPQERARFGVESSQCLRFLAVEENPAGHLPPSGQLLRVEGDGFTLLTLRAARHGGWLLRLMETAGQESIAAVTPGLLGFERAWRCNLVEQDEEPLPVRADMVEIPLRAGEIATVRLV